MQYRQPKCRGWFIGKLEGPIMQMNKINRLFHTWEGPINRWWARYIGPYRQFMHLKSRELLGDVPHTELDAATLFIDIEDAYLDDLADGDDGEGVFDEAVG